MTKVKNVKTEGKVALTKKMERYLEAVGRRKTSVARVRLAAGKGLAIAVNDKDFKKYFPLKKFQGMVAAPLAAASVKDAMITAKVEGGGVHAQAEAVRLGIARALVAQDAANRPRLKTLGFLKRDPRMVERKKPGLRKARRPQQWRKR